MLPPCGLLVPQATVTRFRHGGQSSGLFPGEEPPLAEQGLDSGLQGFPRSDGSWVIRDGSLLAWTGWEEKCA